MRAIVTALALAGCRAPASNDPTTSACDRDGDQHEALGCDGGDDCHDGDPSVHPGAEEQCNDRDDNCDGIGWSDDADGDGFLAETCMNGDDCDDSNPNVHVGAPEVCSDGVDSDCDGRDPFCGYVGDYDLADTSAKLSCGLDDYDAGRLVEAGDVTGDGIDDVIVATLYADGGNGGGYVMPGPTREDHALEHHAFRIASSEQTAGAGRAIGLGDANGDGYLDLSFGAPYADDNGQYIVFGPVTADVNLADDSAADLTATPGTLCGHGSDLGDVNDDGYEDAIVGAYAHSSGASDSGTVFVEFGPLTGHVDLVAEADVEIAGANEYAYAGRMIRVGQDVDGDGVGDFAVNAVFDNTGGPYAGGVYVVHGPVSIDSLDDAGAFLVGRGPNDFAGTAFTAGDFDGDGRADLAVSLCMDGGTVSIVASPVVGTLDLGAADTIIERDGLVRELGSGLGSGDVDSDGIDELLIGAPATVSNGQASGAAFLVQDPPSGTWQVEDIAQASFWGAAPPEQSGQGVAIGDVDDDGWRDPIIGAPAMSPGGGVYVAVPPL